ncbi:glycerol-3-phosphate dehydrogenase/oxidase [Flavobacteriaceae bacterium]|nr:glycerol-3-phosphate dehydrogenase/oxidase [Flavobacteriaceae bacterium]MDA8703781.1 glycerol-3-phosphate dehydrogenase/oxidase [Flavobacteriaceae bacterium]MDA9084313.1 glycerol-3-phosphate dehydrogenase/oxidase [Flavobacteriaceae bacterium]MDA9818018.1 glycerol-3-phosphate dehydrogenase/oxidase [Flavobacteriaceae bacterium]MDB3874325.1 glycerol-3-phosphate dehydrogenase/oxidase [Flavobacteriaceae bacterium]
MNRKDSIIKLNKVLQWDVVIIGGGASGLGIALDASKRGYKTLLLEKYDFAKGTSSRSTKLIHGGVRYLQNGDITLVIESLKERGILKRNAPHLVQDLSFVIPTYDWWASPFYGIGMKIYDMMAGKLGLGKSEIISKEETEKLIPNISKKGLRGGVIYHDGQFDDSRMAITLALSADSKKTTLLNYCNVEGLIKKDGEIIGLNFTDLINSKKYQIKSKVVINATGVFAEEIIRMDQPKIEKMIQPSQGVHIVLERRFLKSKHAILIPQTSDGRVLFAVPWKNYVVVGTTDTHVKKASEEPKALNEEIDFILKNAGKYMSVKPKRDDIKSVFAGLRPLAATSNKQSTKEVSRSHKIDISPSGLISVLGGKWTTYRKIAEDALNTAISINKLKKKKCKTERTKLFGFKRNVSWSDPMHVYGSMKKKVESLGGINDNKSLSKKFYISNNIIEWSIIHEMALTVEDILARRTRCVFLDSKESKRISPVVAQKMADVLGEDDKWIDAELKKFNKLIKNYIV